MFSYSFNSVGSRATISWTMILLQYNIIIIIIVVDELKRENLV